jgi:hypothetical protein
MEAEVPPPEAALERAFSFSPALQPQEEDPSSEEVISVSLDEDESSSEDSPDRAAGAPLQTRERAWRFWEDVVCRRALEAWVCGSVVLRVLRRKASRLWLARSLVLDPGLLCRKRRRGCSPAEPSQTPREAVLEGKLLEEKKRL